jgi:hypothetical protein
MSNDEMMKRPFGQIPLKVTRSDFVHLSFFRHSSLGFRHLGSDDTLNLVDPCRSLEIKTPRRVKEMFHPMRAIQLGSLLAAVLLIGCNQDSRQDQGPDNPVLDETLSWSGWEKELTLDVANWEGIQERIAAHKGQVVVLDMWATY